MNVVDVLSIGASISTMIGLLIAIVSLGNYYREKRDKLEYDVKKDFFDGANWECIGENGGFGSFHLKVHISNFVRINGQIEYSKTINTEVFNIENILFFEVKKVRKKEITIEIHQIKEVPTIEVVVKDILGTATLEHITPHEFTMTLNGNFLPEIPRIVSLDSYEYYHKLNREKHNKQSTNSIDAII